MNKPNFAKFFNDVKHALTVHSPEILTGIGIAGMITTTVLAVRATPKAVKLIEDKKKEESVDKLPALDTVKTCWKCYIPAAVTCVTSTACLIGASSVSLRRNAALATAYKISETALTEYREKVVETIGEKKERGIKEKIAQDKLDKHPSNSSEIYITEKGNTKILDPISHRYFKSDREIVNKAVNKLNNQMIHDISGYISLNEFYDEIGLARTDIGDDLGWKLENRADLITIDFYPGLDDNGDPCLVLDYLIRPAYGYSRYS